MRTVHVFYYNIYRYSWWAAQDTHTDTDYCMFIYCIFIQEYVPYYDRVAYGLNWEATRAAVVGKDAAGAGSPGVSVSGI